MHYAVDGGTLPVLRITMKPGEWVDCETGSMSWMDDGIQLHTGTNAVSKMVGRPMDDKYVQRYVATAPGEIVFAAKAPGTIKAITIHQSQGLIVQRGSFLACVGRINNEIFIQKRLATGFFGSEGFIMRRFLGEGIIFIEMDGSSFEYDIPNGGTKVVEPGFLAAMSDTCKMDIRNVDGVPNVLYGGETLFDTVITGPGKIMLQSMPVGVSAAKMYQFVPHGGA